MADTIDNPTPDTPAPDNKAPDVAGELASLKAQIEGLTKAKTEADNKAEEARKAALSEADKLKEERAAFMAEVEGTKAGIRKEARGQAMDRLGILPNYRDFAPDVDPRDPAGAKALTDWAQSHPEVVKAQGTHNPAPMTPPPESMLGKVLSGVAKSPYMTKEGFRKLIN